MGGTSCQCASPTNFGRIAMISELNSGVGMGAPTARSAAQWARAPIASIRWLGGG